MYNINVNLTIMPNFKKNTGYEPFKMKGSPVAHKFDPHTSEKKSHTTKDTEGKYETGAGSYIAPHIHKTSPASYKPFKMKHAGSNPMHKNFSAAFKQVDDIKNPVAGASPLPDRVHNGRNLREESDTWKRLHWPDGTHRTEREIFDYDNLEKEESKDNEKEGIEDAVIKGAMIGGGAKGKKGRRSPVNHNLPGLRHTKPKIHGEFKQPHVHGYPDKGKSSDPTNKKRPTKVKRKVYRKSK